MRVSATERREQLIDATIELMQSQGVAALNLRDIAKHAGASLATVHYCFADKDELIHAAVERWLKNMLTYAEDVDPTLGLRCTMTEVGNRFWAELEATPSDLLAQIEIVVWAVRQDGNNDLAARIYPGYEQGLGTLFSRAIEAHNDVCSVPPGDLARGFIAIIDGCILQHIAEPGNEAHRRIFDFLLESVLLRVEASVPQRR